MKAFLKIIVQFLWKRCDYCVKTVWQSKIRIVADQYPQKTYREPTNPLFVTLKPQNLVEFKIIQFMNIIKKKQQVTNYIYIKKTILAESKCNFRGLFGLLSFRKENIPKFKEHLNKVSWNEMRCHWASWIKSLNRVDWVHTTCRNKEVVWNNMTWQSGSPDLSIFIWFFFALVWMLFGLPLDIVNAVLFEKLKICFHWKE